MNNSARNRRKAKEILDFLVANPERHNQAEFFVLKDMPEDWSADDAYPTNTFAVKHLTEDNMCKTTMCIAGSAVYVGHSAEEIRSVLEEGHSIDWVSEGAKVLGLDIREAKVLFYADNRNALELLEAVAEGNEAKFQEIRYSDSYRTVS